MITTASFGTLTISANAVILQIMLIFSYVFEGIANTSSVFAGKAAGQGCAAILERTRRLTLHWSLAALRGGRSSDASYACAKAGILAFTGDGVNPAVMEAAVNAIGENHGAGVTAIKPWNQDLVMQKMDMAKKCGAWAIAMDIDGAGLPFLKNLMPPAGSKTVEQLKEIADYAGVPFILKGIMTVKGAEKAVKAGAKAIIVSNHGGRVLDQCPATAEVLPEIVDAVGKDVMVLVDGGIRTGLDVF